MTEIESVGESQADRDRFNNGIAIAVALISAFMAVSKIKDDNVVQSMQAAQADKIDYWGEYQARRQRQYIAETTVAQIKATMPTTPTPEILKSIEDFTKQAEYYKGRADESSVKAKKATADYDALNQKDDLFDLSDAFLSVALALFAVTALVRVRWLFGVAAALGAAGGFFGVAAFAGWVNFHPDFLISFLN